MICPHCQADNSEKAKFCKKCGKTLETNVTCHLCKHSNPTDSLFCEQCGQPLTTVSPTSASTSSQTPQVSHPASFVNGRYQVKKFLGEGGKKKVYLAHDSVLDRDVAFALIKTEKLDETALSRIKREAQAMGKLGDHPHIMSIFDLGDQQGQPYIVLPIMPGGDVEGLIKKASDHKLPIEQALNIATAVSKGLEFAHSRGIIHRDLKPGNVWLTADGTAKIGDFGLAVALDLSRLTGEGMMVGTVSYMPPEQAMGGEVTPKADLYSLGAMLYEMVTGRPPFVGDDSVAIIGQHINTPPVSPTWHRADLPPALETLIMQLLEKDPQKRPESAKVVLQALEAIAVNKVKTEPATETKAPASDNPLYRRVFVGREAELKQLQSAFDGAISGQGSLMMVMGEPGIGKTALCEQLATYVTLRGGRALTGHCYEEGSLSLPYLAFVEALRSYVMSRPEKELREELGTGATDVARILSEIRERLKVKLRPQKDPEEERYRLMQAVTSFITHAACVQPLLIVLEDLHDADKGTLDMLTHVSRNLAGARFLIVGTYRDVEVDRNHPLSAALAELRRVSTYGRVLLRGLNADEVNRMLESITGQSVPWGLAEAVHRQTEGNPLFVQEVIRYLNEEGLIKREGGRWKEKSDTQLAMSIPEGLRDVIGKRLSLLGKECNQLLSIAAVIGREFSLDTLKAVSKIDEEVFMQALKEAVRLSVLEERPQVGVVRYRFTHAFFRLTLYEEMIAPQRLKLHQQVARALESQYLNRPEEHAAELAEHFSQSTDSADLAKAVKYGEMAAARAAEVYAYGEAVRLLDQAIKMQEVLDPEDKAKLCDMLLTLCLFLLAIPDAKRILDSEAPAAFALAESIGDGSRAATASIRALDAISISEVFQGLTGEAFARWLEKAEQYARPETFEKAMVETYQGWIKLALDEVKPGIKLILRALEVGRRLQVPYIVRVCGAALLQYRTCPQYVRENSLLAEELWATRSALKGEWAMIASFAIGSTFLSGGQRKKAEVVWKELRETAHRSGSFSFLTTSLAMDATLCFMDGNFSGVFQLLEQIRSLAEKADAYGLAFAFMPHTNLRSRILLGMPLDSLETKVPQGAMYIPELCLIQAHRGKLEKVKEILNEQVVSRPGIGTAADETRCWVDTLYLESAVLAGHPQAAELLLGRLSGVEMFATESFPTCIQRHLGAAAAFLGRHTEAREQYLSAIKVCSEMPFRPELALSRLQLAELLLAHYPDEKKEAVEHLDFAIKEFREMKMQPSLERALRHKNILKA